MNSRLFSSTLITTLLTGLSIFLTSAGALAGGNFSGGGGGVGYQCGERVFLADTYGDLYQRDNQKTIKAFASWNAINLTRAMFANVGRSSELERTFSSLKFREVAVVASTGDSGITTAPEGCTLIQLARQDGDGNVEISVQAKNLSVLEQALLNVHETQLRWLIQTNSFSGNTTGVRSWVTTIMNSSLAYILQPTGSTMVVQTLEATPVCFRGNLFRRVKPQLGTMGTYAVNYSAKQSQLLIELPVNELTPGVPGERCSDLADRPAQEITPFASFRLSKADRERIEPIITGGRWPGGDDFRLLDGVRVGTCVLTSGADKRNDGDLQASVKSDCEFPDVNSGKTVKLEASERLVIRIHDSTLRVAEYSGTGTARYYHVDEPIQIVRGATSAEGDWLDEVKLSFSAQSATELRPFLVAYSGTSYFRQNGNCETGSFSRNDKVLARLNDGRALIQRPSGCVIAVDLAQRNRAQILLANQYDGGVSRSSRFVPTKDGGFLLVQWFAGVGSTGEIFRFTKDLRPVLSFGNKARISSRDLSHETWARMTGAQEQTDGQLKVFWETCTQERMSSPVVCVEQVSSFTSAGRFVKTTKATGVQPSAQGDQVSAEIERFARETLEALATRITVAPPLRFDELARNAKGEVLQLRLSAAIEFCQAKGARLPTVRELAEFAKQQGAKGIVKSCQGERTCQEVRPSSEKAFFYDSAGFNSSSDEEIENFNLIPKLWSSTEASFASIENGGEAFTLGLAKYNSGKFSSSSFGGFGGSRLPFRCVSGGHPLVRP